MASSLAFGFLIIGPCSVVVEVGEKEVLGVKKLTGFEIDFLQEFRTVILRTVTDRNLLFSGAAAKVGVYQTEEAAKGMGVELVPLDDLLRRSDFISVHVPLGEQTRGMINRERIARMKPGAIFINTARGGVVESLDVLANALESGHLGAVGLDVFPTDPPPTPPIACSNTPTLPGLPICWA